MSESIGELYFDDWFDGTAVVYLNTRKELGRAPRLPMEPQIRLAIKWVAVTGGVLMAMAAAGLVFGIRDLAGGDIVAGVVISGISVVLAGLGVILLAGAGGSRLRRGHHVKLDADAAAAFNVLLAEAKVALGPSPSAADIASAQDQLWEQAHHLQRSRGQEQQ